LISKGRHKQGVRTANPDAPPGGPIDTRNLFQHARESERIDLKPTQGAGDEQAKDTRFS